MEPNQKPQTFVKRKPPNGNRACSSEVAGDSEMRINSTFQDSRLTDALGAKEFSSLEKYSRWACLEITKGFCGVTMEDCWVKNEEFLFLYLFMQMWKRCLKIYDLIWPVKNLKKIILVLYDYLFFKCDSINAIEMFGVILTLHFLSCCLGVLMPFSKLITTYNNTVMFTTIINPLRSLRSFVNSAEELLRNFWT